MYSYNKVNMFNIQNKIKKKNNLQIKKQNTSKPRRTITAMTITTTIKNKTFDTYLYNENVVFESYPH